MSVMLSPYVPYVGTGDLGQEKVTRGGGGARVWPHWGVSANAREGQQKQTPTAGGEGPPLANFSNSYFPLLAIATLGNTDLLMTATCQERQRLLSRFGNTRPSSEARESKGRQGGASAEGGTGLYQVAYAL